MLWLSNSSFPLSISSEYLWKEEKLPTYLYIYKKKEVNFTSLKTWHILILTVWHHAQTMNLKRYLNWGLLQMTKIWCCLSWFLAQYHHVGVNKAERINYNFTYNKRTEHPNPDLRYSSNLYSFCPFSNIYNKNVLIQQTYWMICLTTSSAVLHDKLIVTQLSLNAKGPFTLILTIVYYIQDDSVFNLYLSSCIKEENSANWFPSSGAGVARHLLIWGPIYTAILNQ